MSQVGSDSVKTFPMANGTQVEFPPDATPQEIADFLGQTPDSGAAVGGNMGPVVGGAVSLANHAFHAVGGIKGIGAAAGGAATLKYGPAALRALRGGGAPASATATAPMPPSGGGWIPQGQPSGSPGAPPPPPAAAPPPAGPAPGSPEARLGEAKLAKMEADARAATARAALAEKRLAEQPTRTTSKPEPKPAARTQKPPEPVPARTTEPYSTAPGARHDVQYYSKSRGQMEPIEGMPFKHLKNAAGKLEAEVKASGGAAAKKQLAALRKEIAFRMERDNQPAAPAKPQARPAEPAAAPAASEPPTKPIDVQGKPAAVRGAAQRGASGRALAQRQAGMAESRVAEVPRGTSAAAPAEDDLMQQLATSQRAAAAMRGAGADIPPGVRPGLFRGIKSGGIRVPEVGGELMGGGLGLLLAALGSHDMGHQMDENDRMMMGIRARSLRSMGRIAEARMLERALAGPGMQ